MAGSTTRLGLPYPGPSDGPDGADVPYWVQELAAALDNAAMWGTGILSSRPTSTSGSPGIAGRFYYVQGDSTTANNGILWLDTGTSWVQLNSNASLYGDLADRPAANTVSAGKRFFAQDQVAEYLSDGTTWVRIGAPAGMTTIALLSAADSGYILLQGQAWPSTSGIYADLYAKLGGTTLPDFRQFVPVGYKSGDADFGTLLATGGEKKHLLTVGELPAVEVDNTNAGGSSSRLAPGSGLSHNNLQPFKVVNFQAKL